MLLNVLQVALLPVLLGALLNTLLGRFVKPVLQVFPLLAVLAIIFIIAIIVALNASRLGSVSLLVISAVVLHNLTGLLGGYFIPRLLGYDSTTCRTLAIEVGMQNSGLGVHLALKYFSSLAALPGAIFSIWHNISGSILAAYWSGRR